LQPLSEHLFESLFYAFNLCLGSFDELFRFRYFSRSCRYIRSSGNNRGYGIEFALFARVEQACGVTCHEFRFMFAELAEDSSFAVAGDSQAVIGAGEYHVVRRIAAALC